MLSYLLVGLLVVSVHCVPMPCNGNGIFYDRAPFATQCECFQCFSGSQCEKFSASECRIDDGGGNPLLFQEYWANNSISETSVMLESLGYYHTPYPPCMFIADDCLYSESKPGVGLESLIGETIFDLHRAVGNADPTGYNLVYGAGATEMIAAVSWAYRQMDKIRTTKVFAKVPYYDGYKGYVEGMDFNRLEWDGSPDSSDRILEFVTLPNNPTGTFRTPVYPNSFHVYDNAYFWPSLCNISQGGAPRTDDVMMFTLSKLVGYAGVRFGWALVKDRQLATLMQQYISLNHLSNSEDSTARAIIILKAMLNNDVRLSLFSWAKTRLNERYNQLANALPPSIKNLATMPFYAWLKCVDGVDCGKRISDLNVIAYEAPQFGASKEYVRLEMVLPEPLWQEMIKRISTLQ